MTLSLEDALLGFKTTIKHLDGHTVHVERQQITSPGTVMKIVEEGMPHLTVNTKFGMLVVTFDVFFPTKEFSTEKKGTITDTLRQKDLTPEFYNGLSFPNRA